MKYRKKPVVIEAYQTDKELDIETLEGTMHASVGDYIITGVRGEKYPCKPDIFEQTYEPADAPAASPWHRVEEPPKKTAKYLVWVDVNNGVFAAYPELRTAAYNAVYERWYVDGDQRTEWIGTPRYWMPIEPPKEDA